ncbi:hypothetical protein F7R23_03565 [Burkholderia diffusa]|nr:hypothetical protein F7R23_03565 [Burkholderia diffusa]
MPYAPPTLALFDSFVLRGPCCDLYPAPHLRNHLVGVRAGSGGLVARRRRLLCLRSKRDQSSDW